MKSSLMFRFGFTLITLISFSVVAHAQASRTWVSGVGDDANPCSRTAPCHTFAGAISKTSAKGQISVLDPGGYGAVTITKSITLDGNGTLGSILAANVNGIIINAGANDVVTLRNIVIDGVGTGLNGIRFIAGGTLHLENCVIINTAGYGLDFEPTGASQLFISNCAFRNNAGGEIFLKPGASGSVTASIEKSIMEKGAYGLRAEDRSKVMVHDTTATGITNSGFLAVGTSAPVVMNLDGCVSANNGTNGVKANGTGVVVRVSNSTIVNNTGNAMLAISGGQILSFQQTGSGTNNVAGNGVDGTASGPVMRQ